MPQLPAVSELMVGAHLPYPGNHSNTSVLPQRLPPQTSRSETTPRRLVSYFLPPLLALIRLASSTSPLLLPVHMHPIGAMAVGSMPPLAHSHSHLPHILQLAGRITPPATHAPVSLSPHGGAMPQPVGASYAPAPAPSATSAHGTPLTRGATAPSTCQAPAGACPVSYSAPSYVPAADYFSCRTHSNALLPTPATTASTIYPLHYNVYKRTDLVLLLLNSMLRMPLATNIVQHAEHSPAPPHHRAGLFSHEPSYHPIQHVSPYPTSMGPVVYAAPPMAGAVPSYGAHIPPHTAIRGGSIGAVSPVSYGPQPGPAVLQPYGILIASPYGPVIGPGPGATAGAGATLEEASSKLVAEQNYALMNKRRIIKRRTRTGCLTCRKRRIKCDERKPHCFNCERLKKLCLGYEVLPSPNKQSESDNEEKKEKEEKEAPHRSSVYDLL